MKLRHRFYTAAALMIAGLAFMPASYAEHSHKDADSGLNVEITISDRDVIHNYLRENYHPAHCPPGLAKKHNGCLPPGIAKKYQLGHSLPDTVEFQPLPTGILVQLHPVPGYRYVQVDQDVLLIGEATKKVIDAVTLLSAVQ